MSAAQINVTTLIDETERLPCGDWQLSRSLIPPIPPGPCQGHRLQGCCSGCCIKESLDFVVKLCRDLQNIRVAELRELR